MINFNSENQSLHEIIAAQSDGELEITNTNIFINNPVVQQYYFYSQSLSN
jgi:hypothetical protein